jgi:hypothetical protein
MTFSHRLDVGEKSCEEDVFADIGVMRCRVDKLVN